MSQFQVKFLLLHRFRPLGHHQKLETSEGKRNIIWFWLWNHAYISEESSKNGEQFIFTLLGDLNDRIMSKSKCFSLKQIPINNSTSHNRRWCTLNYIATSITIYLSFIGKKYEDFESLLIVKLLNFFFFAK